jgi:hypothetical protein
MDPGTLDRDLTAAEIQLASEYFPFPFLINIFTSSVLVGLKRRGSDWKLEIFLSLEATTNYNKSSADLHLHWYSSGTNWDLELVSIAALCHIDLCRKKS